MQQSTPKLTIAHRCIKTPIAISIAILIGSLSTLADTAPAKPIAMSHSQKVSLDTFFSNFAEANVGPFTKGSISNNDLIEFGFRHLYINSRKKAKSHNDDRVWFSASDVNSAAIRYFGIGIKQNHSVRDIRFSGAEYSMPGADGDPVPFAQINRLFDLGGGEYRATTTIYESGVEIDVDVHSDPAIWVKQHLAVPILGYMEARIRNVGSAAGAHYILESYLKLGLEPAPGTTVLNARPPQHNGPPVQRWNRTLHDSNGTAYTCYFSSNDEVFHPHIDNDRFEPQPFGGGDETGYYVGHYLLVCHESHKPHPNSSTIPLSDEHTKSGSIALERSEAYIYVVPGVAGHPDLLVWEQRSNGRSVDGRIFYIGGGSLKEVKFKFTGKPTAPGANWGSYAKFRRIGPMDYWTCFAYSASYFEHTIWHFDTATGIMTPGKEIESKTDVLPRGAR